VRLETAGVQEIAAPVAVVWSHLIDPSFVAASAAGVESVDPIDEKQYRVIACLGVGSISLRFTLHVRLRDSKCTAALILDGDFLPQSGYNGAQRLFDMPLETRPTAIFASADQMAYGVMRAAEERNIAIPKDIALVGFDDDAPSAHVLPPLTTVRQPSFEMGQEAVTLLLNLLTLAEGQESGLDGASSLPASGESAPSSQQIVLPTSLVVRASSGASHPISLQLPTHG